jgi:hypothetical protein
METARKAILVLAASFAVAGVACLAVAAAVEPIAPLAGYTGGSLLAVAYLWSLVLVWREGKPIQTRSGRPLTKCENPIAYRVVLLVASLFGWVPMLVFLSNLLVAHG